MNENWQHCLYYLYTKKSFKKSYAPFSSNFSVSNMCAIKSEETLYMSCCSIKNHPLPCRGLHCQIHDQLSKGHHFLFLIHYFLSSLQHFFFCLQFFATMTVNSLILIFKQKGMHPFVIIFFLLFCNSANICTNNNNVSLL